MGGKPFLSCNGVEPIKYNDTISGKFYIGWHKIKADVYITIFKQGAYQINLTLKSFNYKALEYMSGLKVDYEIYPASAECIDYLLDCHSEMEFLDPIDYLDCSSSSISARMGLDQQEVPNVTESILKGNPFGAMHTFTPEGIVVNAPKYWNYIICTEDKKDNSNRMYPVGDHEYITENALIEAVDNFTNNLTHKQDEKGNKKSSETSKNSKQMEQQRNTRGRTVKARPKRSRATIKGGSIPGGTRLTRR